jgi:putative transposase
MEHKIMTTDRDDNGFSAFAEVLSGEGLDGLGNAVALLINQAMRIERDRHLNATMYERTEARCGYANGYKPKLLKTRVGQLNFQVPQVRDGGFYPSFLERGLRSERALMATLAEMYVHGVSTRKVSSILEATSILT